MWAYHGAHTEVRGQPQQSLFSAFIICFRILIQIIMFAHRCPHVVNYLTHIIFELKNSSYYIILDDSCFCADQDDLEFLKILLLLAGLHYHGPLRTNF